MNRYDGVDIRTVLNVKMLAKYLKHKTIFHSIELEDLNRS